MKNYERPTVVMAGELAEGVYMNSGFAGADSKTYSLAETFDVDNDDNEAAAENAAGGMENSVGGGQEPGVEGEITEPEAGTEGEAPETGEPEAGTDAETEPDTEPDADRKPDKELEDPDHPDGVDVDVELQGSAHINCDSIYMNGVWQGAKEGAWGGMKLGCKEVLGCTGCPANDGDGCGLLKPNSARYFDVIGSLKPGWEQGGKGPDDSPYI